MSYHSFRRCKELEQDRSTLKTQLGDKQKVQTENESLKVQMDSLHAAVKLEQKKTQDEKYCNHLDLQFWNRITFA